MLQAMFAVWLSTVFFYRVGAYFLDAGFYVYAIASDQAPATPPLVRDAWGDNVFLTHTTISPMIITALLRPILGVPLNFIGYLTIQHAALAVAGSVIFSLGGHLQGASKRTIMWLAATGAVALPLSNIGLGVLAYPHVEILGSSLIALGVCALVYRWTVTAARWTGVTAVSLLVIGFLVREDLGGHLAIAVVAALVCSKPRSLDRTLKIRALLLGGSGAVATVLLLLFQRLVMGSDGSFDISYSGDPAYAHITSGWYLFERLSFFVGSRMDLLGGIVVFILLGVLSRRPALLAYPLACVPWILLNVTSVDPNKHGLGIYGMFPMVIYLTAPLLVQILRESSDTSSSMSTGRPGDNSTTTLSYMVAGVCLLLGGVAGPPNGGGYVYHSLLRYPIVGPGEVSLVHDVIERFAKSDRVIAVDDAVMTLEPVILQDTQLISRIQEPGAYDSILFFPNFGLGQQQIRSVLEGWIVDGSSIKISCLPGGMARADKSADPITKEQTSVGQMNRAIRCHKVPGL